MSTKHTFRSAAHAIAAALFCALVGAGVMDAAPLQAQGGRIWLNNAPEYLRRGDRLDIRFSVPDDSYVAVVHIDPSGELDFLYPTSPYRSEFVRAGRVHALTGLGSASRIARAGDGIGYVYLVASPYPLDFSYFRGAGTGWYWGSVGRYVHGDPFLAFDQVARLIVPRWPSAVFLVDYYGYYVGGYHPYPSYVCSDHTYGYGWGWTPTYGSCLQQDRFLTRYPHYYDTRRYAGDRRGILRQYEHLYPDHRYKEPAGSWVRQVPTRTAPPVDSRGADFVPVGSSRGQAAPPVSQGSGRSPQSVGTRETVRPAASGTAQGRVRPAPGGEARPSAGSARPATTNRAGAGVSGAPTTNRAAGRGAVPASPATSRGRP